MDIIINITHQTKQPTAIVRTLLFSIGILLSCNSFAVKPISFEIGDTGPGNGIVFHVSGDGKHGLEVAQDDQDDGTGIQWYNGSDLDTHAAKSGINGGSFNTDRIITIQGGGDYAALLCANHNGGGYGDWYLPSKDELQLIYENLYLSGLGDFVDAFYWSSTEGGNNGAWFKHFANGYQNTTNKYNLGRVRAVRAF